jgi:hypothetical protein
MAKVARYSSLRASDADRDSAVQRLRKAHLEGRLESYELEERVHTALRARTYGELDRLLADLPQPPTRRPRPAPQAVPVARVAFGLAVRVVIGLAVLALVFSVAALFAAWWLVWIFIWLAFRATRGHCGAPSRHRPPYHSVSRLT